MEFNDWIKQKISDWLATGKSETQLAREIGISQATLNAMKNNTRGRPRDKKIIESLYNYFSDDPGVVEALGVVLPEVDPRTALLAAGFPAEYVDRFLAARLDFTAELASKGIETDSPEARQIVKDAFARYGIQLIDT